MIQDISDTYDRRLRQSYSNKNYDPDFLRTLVYNNNKVDGLIKAYLVDKLNGMTINTGSEKTFRITDPNFKDCLINEANLQFNKSLYNWSVYKRLVSKGLWSWAFITLYYSQFYAINGLLNIQGNVFTRPTLQTQSGLKETQLHIYTEDFQSGVFICESRRLNKPHEDVWRQYHDVYKNYRFKLKEYNELYQHDSEDPFQSIELRNHMNYDISYNFIEYSYSVEDIEQFITKMKQNVFEITDFQDDEHLSQEYYASLRLKLFFDVLHYILGAENFIGDKRELHRLRESMLNNTGDETCVKNNYINWFNTTLIAL